eukprot:TRINITY_DN5548_c0_g1_i1.p2 TRINITY_DN5548_c0_g1~~TRINITY_DN5548_c0_g1_i1.p2  ORF type:complete len:77 (+),score=2.80 TRINITY_DN5548_c0_g1_i1:195-425(+)
MKLFILRVGFDNILPISRTTTRYSLSELRPFALAVGGLPAGILLPKFGPQIIGVFGAILYAGANYLAILVRSLFLL